MRRINLRAAGIVAVAAGLLAVTAACQSGSNTGDDDATCGGKIATFGAFSGPNAGLVIPSLNGAKLAVKQHNAANADCQVTLEEYDSQGSGDTAVPFAQEIVQDAGFLGVIGGHFSGETAATAPIFDGAGLAMVSPSATRLDLTDSGWEVFHRVVGNDGTQGAAVAWYVNENNATKVFTVDDGSPYGAGIVDELKAAIGDIPVESDKVQEQQTEFSTLVGKIAASGADYIFYGGYTREAAPLIRQLRDGGVTATFIGPDGLYDPGFAEGAGGAAEGAIITCPCLPAAEAGGTFAADYEAEYGEAPGSYGAEGYDAAKVFLDAFLDGATTREDVLAYVKAYDKQGVSKHIKFNAQGDVDPSVVVVWSYEIEGTEFTPLEPLQVG